MGISDTDRPRHDHLLNAFIRAWLEWTGDDDSTLQNFVDEASLLASREADRLLPTPPDGPSDASE